jgi:hypothetical protein
MALLEYDIKYVNGKADVTYKLIEVDEGDRIRFTSASQASIKYLGDSPFNDPQAPKADEPFDVYGTTQAFNVTKRLTDKTRIPFVCRVTAWAAPDVIGLKPEWAGGNGTPPDF